MDNASGSDDAVDGVERGNVGCYARNVHSGSSRTQQTSPFPFLCTVTSLIPPEFIKIVCQNRLQRTTTRLDVNQSSDQHLHRTISNLLLSTCCPTARCQVCWKSSRSSTDVISLFTITGVPTSILPSCTTRSRATSCCSCNVSG